MSTLFRVSNSFVHPMFSPSNTPFLYLFPFNFLFSFPPSLILSFFCWGGKYIFVRGSSKLFFSLRPFSRLSLVSNIKLEQTQASTWLGKKASPKNWCHLFEKNRWGKRSMTREKKLNIKKRQNHIMNGSWTDSAKEHVFLSVKHFFV